MIEIHMVKPEQGMAMCRTSLQRKRVLEPLVLILLPMLLTACTGGNPRNLQELIDIAKKQLEIVFKPPRTPGPSLIDPLDKVWAAYRCASRALPWVLLQSQQLEPTRIAPNNEINERFVYALCPASGQNGLRGSLTRRVLFRGTATWSDIERDYELQAGRWSVDIFLTIPENAEAGFYQFEVVFETNKVIFRDVKSFTVVRG